METMNTSPTPTIEQAIVQYLEMKKLSRAEGTAKAYKYALDSYCQVLLLHDISLSYSATEITERSVSWFLYFLKDKKAATEKLYTAALVDFFNYLISSEIKAINMPKVKQTIQQQGRKQPKRLFNYATDEIERLIECAEKFASAPAENDQDRLINLRDRALILTLADTGLRIGEACRLRRGDLNMNTGQAIVIGKGDKQAVVRFTVRSIEAIRDYLAARTPLMDGKTGKPLASLRIFSRHDKGAGSKVKGMTTVTGRDIMARRVKECLDKDFSGTITPHTLRHRFVTEVLRSSNNLKLAQELARHDNIQVTERYAHLTDKELDDGYRKAFEK